MKTQGLFFFKKISYTLGTMVNRMRHNRSQRGSTRSHHALSGVSITKCPDCGMPVSRHRACSNCGKYRGKVVVDLEAKAAKAKKKTEKSKKK